jgi:hypothetical protein
MPKRPFHMPEHRFQMPELRFQNFPLIKFGRLKTHLNKALFEL